jgi:hypothetical protein
VIAFLLNGGIMGKVICRYWLAIFFCVAFVFFNSLDLKADLPVEDAKGYLLKQKIFTQEDLDGISAPNYCSTFFGANLFKIEQSRFKKKPEPNAKKKAYYYLIVLGVNESTPDTGNLNELISSAIESLKKLKGDSVTAAEIAKLEEDFSEASDSESEIRSRDSFSSQGSGTF